MNADYIVVGAGAGGCVAASALAAAGHSVLVVEAGGRARGPLFSVPLATGILLRSTIANWAYVTEPEAALGGRRLKWPRGRALGGSTAINGMVYMRGLPGDYERWAGMGLAGWSWRDVRPVFERIEARIRPERSALAHPFYRLFLESAAAAGHSRCGSFNGEAPEGAGAYEFTLRGGRRVSAATAFLGQRPRNLVLRPRAQVLRLLIDNGRCAGVVTAAGTLRARREVIVAAGAVGSPHLLMLSGIGPAGHLASHGVAVARDLPGVGANLQDHLLVRVMHATPYRETIDRLRRVDRALMAGARAWLTGTGPAASFPIEVGGLFRSDPALAEPDLQASFMPGLSTATLRLPFAGMAATPDTGRGFFANIFQMRPQSRGDIRLASADPRVHPQIRPNYLTAEADIAVLRAGVRRLRDIFGQATWGAWRGRELQPGPDVCSDAAVDRFIRDTADTVFHPVGTCRMGVAGDAMAVVDEQLRVRGVPGLRIADASVMPSITSSNTAAPTMMIGARAADFILSERTAP